MNDVMSLGIHRCWKDEFVQQVGHLRKTEAGPATIIDMAGGTGDISFKIIDRFYSGRKISGYLLAFSHSHFSSLIDFEIRVMDINKEMLAQGEERAHRLGYTDKCGMTFEHTNAEELTNVKDNSVDLYTIGRASSIFARFLNGFF